MANVITREMLDAKVQGIVLSKVCSVAADSEGKAAGWTKQVTVEVDFSGVVLGSVFNKALASTVITVQNGKLRKQYASLKHGQVIKVQFSAPAATDPIQASLEKFKAMTPEQKAAYMKQLQEMAE